MKYIEKHLSPNEVFQSMFKQHWSAYFRLVSFWSVLLSLLGVFFFELDDAVLGFIILFLIVFGIPFLVYGILLIKMRELGLTSKRVVMKNGIISIKTDELKLNKVEVVEVKQGVIGRILSYGDVDMRGTGG